MAKFALFACFALAVISLGGSQATDEKESNRSARQADELYYDPYDLESLVADVPVYQPTPRIQGIYQFKLFVVKDVENEILVRFSGAVVLQESV